MQWTSGDAQFDQDVADWVLWQFPELEKLGRYKPFKSLAMLDEHGISGAIVMTNFNGFDACLSIYAPKARWDRKTLKNLFGWCFDGLGLKRLTVEVSVKNKLSCRFVERLGFIREGVIRYGYAGKEHLAHYGMLRKDCKYLKD